MTPSNFKTTTNSDSSNNSSNASGNHVTPSDARKPSDNIAFSSNGSHDKSSSRLGHGFFDMLTSAFRTKVTLTDTKKPSHTTTTTTSAASQRPHFTTLSRRNSLALNSPTLRKRSSSSVSHSSLAGEGRKRDSNGINYAGFINALSELQQQQAGSINSSSSNSATHSIDNKLKTATSDDDNVILYTIRRDEPTRTPPPSIKPNQHATVLSETASSHSVGGQSSSSSSSSNNGNGSSANSGRITKRPAATTTLLNNPHSSSNSINNYIKDIECIQPEDLGKLLQQNLTADNDKNVQKKAPLLIDMRPLEQFERAQIIHSININVPTLLIKRYRRGVIPNNFNLESFITTPEGTDHYRAWLEQFKDGDEDIQVIIYDDHTTFKDKSTGTWTLAGVIYKIIHCSTGNSANEIDQVVHGLQGGFQGFVQWDKECQYLGGSKYESTSANSTATTSNSYTGLDSPPLPLPSSSANLLRQPNDLSRMSPTPMISRSATTLSHHHRPPNNLSINTNTDAPSTKGNVHRRASLFSLDTNIRPSHHKLRPINIPQLNEQRKLNRIPPLKRYTPSAAPIHTSSSNATTTVPTTSTTPITTTTATNNNNKSSSPIEEETFYTPMTSRFSIQRPPPLDTKEDNPLSYAVTEQGGAGGGEGGSLTSASASYSSASATATPLQQQQQLQYPTDTLDSTIAHRGDDDANNTHLMHMATMTPKTEYEYDFVISEIIPNFLYLGPEIQTEEQVMGLKERAIKRILNMAEECDDDVPGLKESFDYKKIAARDTVEMQNVQGTLKKAVRAIDDSKKHHEPIYVHCKAGKSRSAAAILAYLVLSEHWTLKKAYQHIVKARPNISPNIGFVAELMKMEEVVHGQVSNFASTDWQMMLTNPPSPDTQKEMGRLERVWKRGRSSSNVTRNASLKSNASSRSSSYSKRNSLDSNRASSLLVDDAE